MADLRFGVPASRQAQAVAAGDLILRFDNRERYIAQSAATKTGRPAPLPPRAPLSRILNPPR